MNNSFYSFATLFGLMWIGVYLPATDPSFELVWEDHFDQQTIDTASWSYAIGNGCPDLCGWGNNELQSYSSNMQNVRLENGRLLIEAHKDTLGNFTSAKLITKNKLDWKYGKVELRAKIPTGKGTWMAFWMLPTLDRDMKWPLDGEIDIVEHVGYNPNVVYGTIHTEKYNGMKGTQKVDSIQLSNVENEFHTYAIEWSEDEIKWLVDGKKYHHLEKGNESNEGWPFNQYDYHLIINLAIGGDWGGKMGVDDSSFPQRMEVDYVKYFKIKSN